MNKELKTIFKKVAESKIKINAKQAGGGGRHQLQIALKSLKNINWKGKRILDIGCGKGNVTNEILKFTQAREIIGIDIDPDRILKANQLKYKLQENKLNFIKADITELSQFDDNSFDGVFSNMTFQQIPVKKFFLALKEIKRLLKPSASAIINFNQEKSEVTLEIQKIVLKKENISKAKNINLEIFKKHALNAEFSKVECITQFDTYYHKSIDDLLGDSKKIFSTTNIQLNDNQIKEVWQKIQDIFKKRKTSLGYKESWNIVFAQLTK